MPVGEEVSQDLPTVSVERLKVGKAADNVVLDGLAFKTHGSNISRSGNEKDGYKNTTLGARAFFQA